MTKFYMLMQALFGAHDETEDRGAAMVEYALLVAFIAVVALVGVTALGTNINDLFESISF